MSPGRPAQRPRFARLRLGLRRYRDPSQRFDGRDGKISHLDLVGKKLEKAIAQAIAQKP